MLDAQSKAPSMGEPTEQFNARIPASLHQRVKLFCVANRQRIHDFTREALEEKLAREGVGTQQTEQTNVYPLARKGGSKARRR